MKKVLSLLFFAFYSCYIVIAENNIKIAVYYFDGWAGINQNTTDKVSFPSHLNNKLKNEYGGRMPLWGWRDDTIEIMEKQINLASENGIDYFVFCWYWKEDLGPMDIFSIESQSLHTSIELFRKAKNKGKMKYFFLVANHKGHRIIGEDNWCSLFEYLNNKYFQDKEYLKIEGKPVVSIFLGNYILQYLPSIRERIMQKTGNNLFVISCNCTSNNFNLNTWYNNTFENLEYNCHKSFSSLSHRTESIWYNQPTTINVAPMCMSGWDKRPWFEQENFIYYSRPTGYEFYTHLLNAKEFISVRKEKYPIIFIYAWNEYGEGGYLTPTINDQNGILLKQIKKIKYE